MPAAPRKLFESEAAALVHDHYVVTKLVTRCVCGATWQHSELYEVWTHPTKTATTGMKQLRSTTEFKPDLELHAVQLKERALPVCSSCWQIRRPKPQTIAPPLTWDEWAATLQRKAAERKLEASAAPAAARQSSEPKLENL